jgi:hypothetical protein
VNEPKRWLDQGAPRDVEQLVRAAQAERPGSASLARSLAAVGVGIAATGVVASAKAAGAAASVGGTTKVTMPFIGGVFAKWAALGALGGTLAVGIVEVATDSPRPVAPSPSLPAPAPLRPGRVQSDVSPMHAAPTAPSAAPGAPAESPAAPPESTAMAAAAPNAPRPVTPGGGHAAPSPTSLDSAPASSSSDADTLAAEVKSIDRARAALAAGKPAQALGALEDYERVFRKRGFAPEALYLRMEACASLGRTAEARAAAERLLASYPNSLHTARARAVLSKNP